MASFADISNLNLTQKIKVLEERRRVLSNEMKRLQVKPLRENSVSTLIEEVTQRDQNLKELNESWGRRSKALQKAFKKEEKIENNLQQGRHMLLSCFEKLEAELKELENLLERLLVQRLEEDLRNGPEDTGTTEKNGYPSTEQTVLYDSEEPVENSVSGQPEQTLQDELEENTDKAVVNCTPAEQLVSPPQVSNGFHELPDSSSCANTTNVVPGSSISLVIAEPSGNSRVVPVVSRTPKATISFVCKTCKKPYKHKKTLVRHLKLDHGGVKLFCPKNCGHSTTRKSDLDRHVGTCTGQQRKKRMACAVCRRLYLNRTSLLNHYIKMHDDVYPDPRLEDYMS